jgi:predicted PurR-regulated permease PerM
MSTSPLTPVAPAETPRLRPRPANEEIAAWILLALLVLYVMTRHLVAGVVGGLTLYLVLDWLEGVFARRIPRTAARPLALALVTLVGGGFIFGAIALAVSFLRHHAANVPAMMTQMADILQSTRAWLGGYGEQIIPEVLTDAETIKAAIVAWLKEHAETVRLAGSTVSLGLVHMIMGMLLAILVFFRHVTHSEEEEAERGTLARYLGQKVDRFAHAFQRIATAQVKISAVNTTLTGLYLLVVLPMFGAKLPFSKTVVLVTFLCGLIPVLGNLISNTVIVVLSLGISPATAIASLTFLVLIHKLEYLINSRIVGGETDSQAWEILMAILIGETAFGVSGVVMGPIVYAFVKRELRDRGLV